jgi:hypothetical protein
VEELMAGHVGVMGFIKLGRELQKGHGGTRWKLEAERSSSFRVLLERKVLGRTW